MPCRSFYRHGRSLVKKFPAEDFVIIGVNRDEETWIPQRLASDGRISWRSFEAAATNPDFVRTYGARTLGLMVLIDQKGVINQLFNHADLEEGHVVESIAALLAGKEDL